MLSFRKISPIGPFSPPAREVLTGAERMREASKVATGSAPSLPLTLRQFGGRASLARRAQPRAQLRELATETELEGATFERAKRARTTNKLWSEAPPKTRGSAATEHEQRRKKVLRSSAARRSLAPSEAGEKAQLFLRKHEKSSVRAAQQLELWGCKPHQKTPAECRAKRD